MAKINRRLPFLIVCAFLAGHAHAGDTLKALTQKLKADLKAKQMPLLAVLDFPYSLGRLSTGSILVSERLLTYFSQSDAPVIERRLLQRLLEERHLEESGAFDPRSLKNVGQVLGVQAVVLGTLADFPDRDATEVAVRIVRLDTGEILSAGSAIIDRVWADNPHLPKIAQRRIAVPAQPTTSDYAAEVHVDDEPTVNAFPINKEELDDVNAQSPIHSMLTPKLDRNQMALDGRVKKGAPHVIIYKKRSPTTVAAKPAASSTPQPEASPKQ